VLIAEFCASDGAKGCHPGQHDGEASAWDRVRQTICEQGPLSAPALGSRLGLTPAEVRRHLDLHAEKTTAEEWASAGRRCWPARARTLPEAGHPVLDSDYDDADTSALSFRAQHAGANVAVEFARTQRRAPSAVCRTARHGGRTGHRPLAGTFEGTRRRGFAASTRPEAAGMHQAGVCSCSKCIARFSTSQPSSRALCDAEIDAFWRLFVVHVQRVTTFAHGELVCTMSSGSVPFPSLHCFSPPPLMKGPLHERYGRAQPGPEVPRGL
jgi:predicted ArsR family transcriptional regulator